MGCGSVTGEYEIPGRVGSRDDPLEGVSHGIRPLVRTEHNTTQHNTEFSLGIE